MIEDDGGDLRQGSSDSESADFTEEYLGSRMSALSTWNRRAISGLLVLHLAAISLPPLMFQSGGSEIVATLLQPITPYCEFLYLDRGYAFFAPDPGPSHLIQAAVTQRDDSRTETMYPDRQQQWPRLLYHRHFMLAEYLTEIYQPPGPPSELVEVDQLAAEEWARLRLRYEHVRQSMVDHLSHENGGKPVAVRRIEHLIPNAYEYQNSDIELSDPLLYQIMFDRPIVVSGSNSGQPVGPPEAIPAPNASRENSEQTLTAPKESTDNSGESSPEDVSEQETVEAGS
jgi:hypothetical protein